MSREKWHEARTAVLRARDKLEHTALGSTHAALSDLADAVQALVEYYAPPVAGIATGRTMGAYVEVEVQSPAVDPFKYGKCLCCLQSLTEAEGRRSTSRCNWCQTSCPIGGGRHFTGFDLRERLITELARQLTKALNGERVAIETGTPWGEALSRAYYMARNAEVKK